MTPQERAENAMVLAGSILAAMEGADVWVAYAALQIAQCRMFRSACEAVGDGIRAEEMPSHWPPKPDGGETCPA